MAGTEKFDLAMMRLFGGFGERCFSAYQEVLALEPGWSGARQPASARATRRACDQVRRALCAGGRWGARTPCRQALVNRSARRASTLSSDPRQPSDHHGQRHTGLHHHRTGRGRGVADEQAQAVRAFRAHVAGSGAGATECGADRPAELSADRGPGRGSGRQPGWRSERQSERPARSPTRSPTRWPTVQPRKTTSRMPSGFSSSWHAAGMPSSMSISLTTTTSATSSPCIVDDLHRHLRARSAIRFSRPRPLQPLILLMDRAGWEECRESLLARVKDELVRQRIECSPGGGHGCTVSLPSSVPRYQSFRLTQRTMSGKSAGSAVYKYCTLGKTR